MLIARNAAQVPALRASFLFAMYAILSHTQGSVTSWIRSPGHNAAHGGSTASLHLLGLALDVVFPTAATMARAKLLAKAEGIHYLDERDHVHFQAMPAGSNIVAAVKQFTTATAMEEKGEA